jgi:hypothetical protein
MRTYEHLIPVTLFTLGLGLVSAFAFEGTPTRDGVAPAVTAEGMPPQTAVTAPALAPASPPAMAVPTLAVPAAPMPGPAPLKRSLTPPGDRSLSPAEAFRAGTLALRAGDVDTGLKSLGFAAENGHVIAQWKLARMYADGEQVARDDVRAFDYFRAIIDNHSDDSLGTPQARFVANAYVALGDYYVSGIASSSVKPDTRHARDLFAFAASYFGDADAQYRLGRMLLEGEGGPKDAWQAVRWLKLAADKGYYQAQALLGVTLLKGVDIPRQAPRGLMYLTIARDTAPQDKTVAELHAAAFAHATDDERAMALSYLEAWLKGRRD